MKETVDFCHLREELAELWSYPRPMGKRLENSKHVLYPEVPWEPAWNIMERTQVLCYEPAYVCSNPVSHLENGNGKIYLAGLLRGPFNIMHLKK